MKHSNTDFKKVKLHTLTLTNGIVKEGYHTEPYSTAPPGFIAIYADDQPGVVEYVKVENIVSFGIDDKDSVLMGSCFDVTPETLHVKGLFGRLNDGSF